MMTEQDRMAIAEEATSLPIHVQMCAHRHRLLLGEVKLVRRQSMAIFVASLAAATGSLAPYVPAVLPLVQAVIGR